MNLPFLNRVKIRKIIVKTSNEAGLQARAVLEQLLNEMPELSMACVVEVKSGFMLASYTTAPALNPNHISLRYAKLLQLTNEALDTRHLSGAGTLNEMTALLEDQLHIVRPMRGGLWYCFLAVRFADANLGMAWEILRRHTS